MSYLVPKWFRQPSSRRVLVTIKFKPFPLLLRFWTGLDPQCFRCLFLLKFCGKYLLWPRFQPLIWSYQYSFLPIYIGKNFEFLEDFNFQVFKITKIFNFKIPERPILRTYFEQFCQYIKIAPSKWSYFIFQKNYLEFTNGTN